MPFVHYDPDQYDHSCGNRSSSENEEEYEDQTVIENYPADYDTGSGDWKTAYAEILRANEDAIRDYHLDDSILFFDLNNDGTQELMFFSGWNLHIYTMKDGSAVECTYDVDPDASRVSTGDAAFVDVHAGSGTIYMIYTGKEDGVFYIAHSLTGSSVNNYSVKYIMDDAGTISTDTWVYNKSAWDIDPDNPETDYDLYYIDGTEVSMKKAVKKLQNHRDDYDTLLMGNGDGRFADLKVFEHFKTDTPLAVNYDEAIKQLGF